MPARRAVRGPCASGAGRRAPRGGRGELARSGRTRRSRSRASLCFRFHSSPTCLVHGTGVVPAVPELFGARRARVLPLKKRTRSSGETFTIWWQAHPWAASNAPLRAESIVWDLAVAEAVAVDRRPGKSSAIVRGFGAVGESEAVSHEGSPRCVANRYGRWAGAEHKLRVCCRWLPCSLFARGT